MKDIYFSFKSLEKNEKIEENDSISFMVSKSPDGEKMWAINIRKYIQKDMVDNNEK